MSQLVEDLLQAKKELDTRGWCQGTLYNPSDGSCCALGAIGLATIGDPFIAAGERYYELVGNPRAVAAIEAVAAQMDGSATSPIDCVWATNDDRDTTLEKVYEFFDKALATATA